MPSFATATRVLRYVLAIVSISSLLFGIALSLGWEPPFRLARKLTLARDPLWPVLLSAGTAALFWTSTNGDALSFLGRLVRNLGSRTAAIRITSLVVAAILLGGVLPIYLQTAPYSYPIGDGAMLEIYTIHAARGVWPFGPYSQFAWHHPGPLLFYLLAPLFAASDYRSIAMHAGAFAINLASVVTIVVVLFRRATPTVTLAVTVVMGVYLYRISEIAGSYWNPHVVVLPVAALIVLCARLAAGRLGALPAVVFAGSFLAQTHVSLVPYVGVLAGAALVACVAKREEQERSLAWWINLTAWLMLLLWLFPLGQQLTGTPGNITKMMQFFGEKYDRQPLDVVVRVWADVMTSPFRPGFHIPVGWPMKPAADELFTIISVAQVLVLAVLCRHTAVRGDRFSAALCGLGALASLIALWSITKIRVMIGDYMVFWMSVIGALNWAIVVGLLTAPLVANRERLRQAIHWAALACSAIVIGGYILAGVRQLEEIRHTRRLDPIERNVKLLSEDLDAYLQRQNLTRPLFRITQGVWGDAASLVLDRYRRGVPVAVQVELSSFYGAPLAPTRREDSVFVIADAPAHEDLSKQPGDILVSHHGPVYIHHTAPDPER